MYTRNRIDSREIPIIAATLKMDLRSLRMGSRYSSENPVIALLLVSLPAWRGRCSWVRRCCARHTRDSGARPVCGIAPFCDRLRSKPDQLEAAKTRPHVQWYRRAEAPATESPEWWARHRESACGRLRR